MGIEAVHGRRSGREPLLFPSRLKEWCPGTELNRRHEDFQSSALPTELPGHPAGGKLRRGKITQRLSDHSMRPPHPHLSIDIALRRHNTVPRRHRWRLASLILGAEERGNQDDGLPPSGVNELERL